ncbi:hypothetical protein [Dyadobacter jejuensis]|uniref:hypothetical protein n=1 Tax=Dyadobacter jejuensis TaxID=1082580 RepID=UPI001B870B31
MFVAITPLEGKARLQIGYAVHPEYRDNGLVKNTVKAAIEELQYGLRRAGITAIKKPFLSTTCHFTPFTFLLPSKPFKNLL